MAKLTAAQQCAVDEQSRTLLVSAAAGSGKTTTLIQRILSQVTRTEDPVMLDRLRLSQERIEGMAKGSLYDVGTESFRETAEHFIESKADFEGETKETMEALKKYAEVTPEKKHKKENFDR